MRFANATKRIGFMKHLGLTLMICINGASASEDDVSAQLEALLQQNELLLGMVQEQQSQINKLQTRLNSLDEKNQRQELEISEIRHDVEIGLDETMAPERSGHGSFRLSGEAGINFFAGERNNQFSNEEFRIGESRLFIEAEIARGTYLFSTIELFRRESNNPDVQVGEVFIDFENPFGLGAGDNLPTARVGRFQIPFGQEYLNRYVFENPLVSHSVADIMGIDEGVEIFGDLDRFSYTLAVMNGGASSLRDLDSGKSIVARVGFQPSDNSNLHLSAMDTGDIGIAGDKLTELWIADTRFRSIGNPATTSEFNVQLAQIDGHLDWKGTTLKTALGVAEYRDDDSSRDNTRHFDFFQIEAVKDLSEQVYGTFRYSRVNIDDGYSLGGNGDPAIFIASGLQTEELERLSLGLGYTPADNIVAKLEYTIEEGNHSDGTEREDTDQVAAEVGVRF